MTRMERRKEKQRKRRRLLICVVFAAVAFVFMASFAARGTPSEPEANVTAAMEPLVMKLDAEAVMPELEEPIVKTPTPVEEPTAEAEAGGVFVEAPAEIEEPTSPEPDEAEVEMLACAIYQEAGGDSCSDKCRYMVGDVVLNRIADSRFPDTMEAVLTEKRQYGEFYWTGIKWPDRASNPGEARAVQRAYDTARAILSGEHSEIYGEGYVWEAEFEQGSDIIELDGLYFGR